jgi:hypothetical protein
MSHNRVIVELDSPSDAKKVEETVKTGFTETSIETLTQWMAVEDDLAESYGRLSQIAKDSASREVFRKLQGESRTNISELSKLLKSLEELDRARVKRVEMLDGLLS